VVAVLLAASSSADAEDWPTFGGDYGNRRHTALSDITPDNVSQLEPVWRIHTGIVATFQATPIVSGGVVYLSTPNNHVLALDAVTGEQRWRYAHASRWEKTCCGPANRGVAVSEAAVFMGTTDARLLALDRVTGSVLWDFDLTTGVAETVPVEAVDTADLAGEAVVTGNTGITANSAPLHWNGLVFQGISGVGYGVHLEDGSVQGLQRPGGNRGFLVAVDAKTGREVWRWHSIRGQGWEGGYVEQTAYGLPLHRDVAAERSAAAEQGESWKGGGASVWNTPALDTATGTLFFGTGNPSPQIAGGLRPGDNLDSVSLVSLDARTGKRRWAYQYVPHDVWGYDAASPAILFDFPGDNGPVPAVGHATKTGAFFVHDRASGEVLVRSEPFVPRENLFAAISEEPVRVSPGAAGGANWNPPAVDPALARVFVPAAHMPFDYFRKPAEGGRPAVGVARPARDVKPYGVLSAIELATGKIAWQRRAPHPSFGGVLATASGLVFYSTGAGVLAAVEAESGEERFRFQADAGFSAPPISYRAAGRQFVLVAAGGNALFGTKLGDELIAFALPTR